MDKSIVRKSSRALETGKIFSPRLSERGKQHESQTEFHHGSKIEQKIQNLRLRMHGHLLPPEVPVVEPLKPMRYVRHFNVSVSLKRSRLLSRPNSDLKQWSIGRRQFNENPKQGIQWLVENNLLQNTPESVATFLFNETGLSKRAIGEYLGEKDDFHIDVLKHFARRHDFFTVDIVEALRRYLFAFLLPGEAQKIDRIMEAFSKRYYECNPDIFVNAEVCFILSYAIIMLNTSLHNKSARMGGPFTYEKFLSSLTEAISQQHMPDSTTLKNIYDHIKNNEFKFPDDGDIDIMNVSMRIKEGGSTIIKEGWLWKQGGLVRNWKRRWFVITDGCLFYYESRTEVDNPRGIVSLIDVGVREIEDDRPKQFCFELFPLAGEKVKSTKPVSGEIGKVTEGHHTVYRMSAPSDDERKDWIRALRIGTQNELPKQRLSYIDNSDYMRDGDFIPSRMQVQQDAVSLIFHAKTRSNPENNVGLLTFSDGRVVTQLTSDVGKVFSKLHLLPIEGKNDFCKGIKVANLALKHRQGKNHRPRIVAFIGSPLEVDTNEFTKLAKRLKKEKVSIDIVIFGDESSKEKFEEFITIINGKENTNSHLICVPSGANLPDTLINTPIIQSEDGSGIPGGYSASAFAFGINPEDDPELAMALRISMEEQRRVQEAEIGRGSASETTGPQNPPTNSGTSSANLDAQTGSNEMDVTRLTEEEQIALAIQMSMSQAEGGNTNDVEMKEEPSNTATAEKPATTTEGQQQSNPDSFAASLNDPQFLRDVLRDLPGVDVDSEAVRAALEQVQQQPKKSDDNDDAAAKKKKDGK
ncbi:hypothetical protein I4U23_003326 [Adineta vaga]|nr:hypothetical protein I4U23_003326 [Adineta vaga]